MEFRLLKRNKIAPYPPVGAFYFMITTENNLPAITQDIAKQKLAISLTKISLSAQSLQNEADSLVFNEDNLQIIGEFISKIKKAEKTIEEEHRVGKEPFLEGGRAWDAAKKDMILITGGIKMPVVEKYTVLCNEIDRKNKEIEQKRELENKIKDGIENNVMDFSQKIASCTSKKGLTDIERTINLEKSPSRSGKYGDFHQLAISRYDEILIPILKDQKRKIDEKEAIEQELLTSDNAEKYDELQTALEEKQNEIAQNQIRVQENALLQTTLSVVEPDVILTEVKARRTEIVAELVDESIAFKKQRELLSVELKLSDAKKLGNTLKDSGAFGDKESIIVNGIKYSIKKSW